VGKKVEPHRRWTLWGIPEKGNQLARIRGGGKGEARGSDARDFSDENKRGIEALMKRLQAPELAEKPPDGHTCNYEAWWGEAQKGSCSNETNNRREGVAVSIQFLACTVAIKRGHAFYLRSRTFLRESQKKRNRGARIGDRVQMEKALREGRI